MLKKNLLTIAYLVTFIALMTSCGPSYNTNFPPPDPSLSIGETFPEKVGDNDRNIQSLNLDQPQIGYIATYGGDKANIQIIQSTTNEEADAYFKDKIVPKFDAMANHSRAQVNGKWFASGTGEDGHIHYAWVNANWIFAIEGVDQSHFDQVISNFKYIAKK